MTHPHYSVSWDTYQRSICNGLSSLQQRGEFVDMTLAADGHHVKVHRMVMSLASPYIRDILTSAECAHPVIFLNQISYKTLCLILEYVYSGEVVVPRECLNSFSEAGKALHIKGLDHMNLEHSLIMNKSLIQTHEEKEHFESNNKNFKINATQNKDTSQNVHEVFVSEDLTHIDDDHMDTAFDDNDQDVKTESKVEPTSTSQQITTGPAPTIQYSLSNQGNLQMILNRYLYYLVYTGRNSGYKRWQCIDNHSKRLKCPAAVVMKNNVIVQRIAAHNHSFHDQKILKKVQEGAVFSAMQQAEEQGKMKMQERNSL